MSENIVEAENIMVNEISPSNMPMIDKKGKMKVKGVAIHSGVSRNGIMYTNEELKKFTKTLKGVSIIKDHEAKIENLVGMVEDSHDMNDGNIVMYDGWIKDEKISEMIKEGMIKHVSIGAICQLVKEKEDSEVMMATDMQCMELSLVVVPGVPGATIQQSLIAHESAKTAEEKLRIKPISEDVCKFISLEEWKQNANEEKSVDNNENVKVEVVNTQEQKEEMKMADESKLTEMQASLTEKESLVKKQLEELAMLKAANAKLAEEKRLVLVESYKKLCKEKNVEEQSVSEMSDDVIKALVTQLEKTKVAQESKLRGQVGESIQDMKFDEALKFEKSSFGKGFSIFRETYNPAKYKRLAR